MLESPFKNKPDDAPGQMSFDKFQVGDGEHACFARVFCMEMRNAMFLVIHGDDDTENLLISGMGISFIGRYPGERFHRYYCTPTTRAIEIVHLFQNASRQKQRRQHMLVLADRYLEQQPGARVFDIHLYTLPNYSKMRKTMNLKMSYIRIYQWNNCK